MFWTWETIEIDKDNVLETYYTYSEPIKGQKGAGSVRTSNIPNSSSDQIEYTEVAQIHTHGAYHHGYTYYNGNSVFVMDVNGFSDEDIAVAKKRKVDTYVVTQWGDLYKSTYKNNYKDGKSPYIIDAFVWDEKIEEIYGYKKRY